MKKGTPQHPKMLHLAQLLKLDLFSAVGLLECLWHWTGQYAPQGDIGKYSDEFIADGLHWRKDPELLIEKLVQSRWLDRDEKTRLIIHDWQDHAEEWVKKKLYKQGLTFCNGAPVYRLSREPVENQARTGREQGANRARTGRESGANQADPGSDLNVDPGAACLSYPIPSYPILAPPVPVCVGTVRELFEALKGTGKFPNLTLEAVAQGVGCWPGSSEHWGKLVVEAESLSDREVGSPVPWISRVLGRYVGILEKKEKTGAGVRVEAEDMGGKSVYVPLGKRKGG